ncbi:amidase [Pelagovum sp. HNIBRBA483]|uniref:amidase n=1 Tax=Pelagovum sp. HNIBRBA483 TaxID=3233341 RepID=UPI0034A25B37
MSDELLYVTATEALARFSQKSLSPVELLEAQITRAEATSKTVNAFAHTHFDEARELARQSEARWSKGEPSGCLDGLPVAIKDETQIAGKPSTCGSLILKDFVADATSPANERILAEGAIAHAFTTTPEFCCALITWSRLWGVTRNPWNTEKTPGGSSGGAAAALASGACSLATGTDIGGSIRVPASCCGLVGYKPTYGRTPQTPPFNLDMYNHTGPLARSVADAALLQNVMCGPHPEDIATLYPKLTLPMNYPGIKGWKIALSMDLGSFEVDEDVRRNTLTAAQVFRDLGAKVEEVDIGWGPEVSEGVIAYLKHLFGASLSTELKESADLMTTYCRDFAEQSQSSSPLNYLNSLKTAGQAYRRLGLLLEEFDCLICPTTALPAVDATFDPSQDRIEINGKEVGSFLGWAMTTPFNMLSRCPVISLPTGFAGNGVPTGMQIVAPAYRDEVAFQAASAFENAVGGWYRRTEDRPAL